MSSILFDYRFGLDKNISNPWIYKDLDVTNGQGSIYETDSDVKGNTDIEAVRRGISNIFNFNQGERIINPEFGNVLNRYLYEPINKYIAEEMGKAIKSMLTRWDPRVVVRDIIINPDPDNNQYHVVIFYAIPSLTNQIMKFNRIVKK